MKLTPNDYNNYLMTIIDKHKMLESSQSPRLILIGGSNLAFGVDSNKIEDKVHMPVINIGLHAGLGLKFMLEDIKPYIRKDDIIVVIPEYEHFYDNTLNGDAEGSLTYGILQCVPNELKYLDTKQIEVVLQGLPTTLYNGLLNDLKYLLHKNYNTQSNGSYRRDGFNSHGDEVAHLNMKSISFTGNILNSNSKYNKETIKVLNNFNHYVNKKNAKVYFDFPCIPEKRYSKSKIEFAYEHIKNDLKFDIIGNPNEYVFPQTYFFNTFYHLNANGRNARTNILIKDLENFNVIKDTDSSTY